MGNRNSNYQNNYKFYIIYHDINNLNEQIIKHQYANKSFDEICEIIGRKPQYKPIKLFV